MTDTEILERIRAIFKENFDIAPERVTPEAHLFEELDLDSIATLVDWQLEEGSHGISVGGSTGEPTSQTLAERPAASADSPARVRQARAVGSTRPRPRRRRPWPR